MTENGNEKRPVRKLTVKNFSVIKEAELEFGKITVLIGPQASGKSLLCKLAYFFEGELPAKAVDSLLDGDSWDEFRRVAVREFRGRFLTEGWLRTNTRAHYVSHRYSVSIHGIGDPLDPQIECDFGQDFSDLYSLIQNNRAKQLPIASASRNQLREEFWLQLRLLLNGRRTQSVTYIPAGRALFTDASKSIVTLQNPDLDEITRRFAGLIAWDSRWKAGYQTTGRGVLQAVEREMYRIAGGAVVVINGKPFFLSSDARNSPLSIQSSGTLELLPAFNIVDQLACFQEDIYARAASAKIPPVAEISEHSPLVYMEEPEAHVFPSCQFELVRLFARLAEDPILAFDWVITTHSPYILSAFGNLLKAGQVSEARPGQSKAVNKIVKHEYWIKPSDFRAYALKPSKTEPGKFETEFIIDDKTGQIDGDYLDNVSSDIAGEFTQLLELQYGG